MFTALKPPTQLFRLTRSKSGHSPRQGHFSRNQLTIFFTLVPCCRKRIEKSASLPGSQSTRINVDAKRRGARFPEQESWVYDEYRKRRYCDGLKVTSQWLRAKMKQALMSDKPEGWTEFKYSDQWFKRFKQRYSITLRARTNKKGKSVEERLPQVQEFHRKVKSMTQGPPDRDPKYGKFPAKVRAHVDQVSSEKKTFACFENASSKVTFFNRYRWNSAAFSVRRTQTKAM